MAARQILPSSAGRRRGLVVAAAVAAAAALAAPTLLLAPAAGAAGSTTKAQLSLSGVATKSNVLGGTTVRIQKGGTVDLVPAAVPTAGLDNLPVVGSLVDSLTDLLGSRLFQVEVTTGANYPGGAKTFTLGGPTSGSCKGDTQGYAKTFPTNGTYNFSWTVKYVAPGLLGGCSATSLNGTQLNQLQKAGVAINASNKWVGSVVVTSEKPPSGINIAPQLPSLGAQPSITGIGKLPSLGLPGVSVPTATIPVPSLPTGGSKTTTPSKGTSTGNTGKTGDQGTVPESVPDLVVPNGDGSAVFGSTGGFTLPGGYDPGALPDTSQLASGVDGAGTNTSGGSKLSDPSTDSDSTKRTDAVDVAAPRPASSQLPVILAVAAMVVLVLVAGAYARLFLIKHNS